MTSKLEPFLLLAKSLKGAAAAKLIVDATSAPSVFVFSELLELPNIQELANNEAHQKSFALLKLFAYRTYQDYIQNKDAYPALNAAQTKKLKHLSIVTLASERRLLPYADLLRELDMPNVRELEDLIIDAIYLDILRGKLDQKEAQLEVEYTMGRDLAPGQLESVLAALRNWSETTASVLQTLDAKLAAVATTAVERRNRAAAHEKALQAALREASERAKERGGGRGGRTLGGVGNMSSSGYFGDAMDVDEPGAVMGRDGQENVKGKGRKPAPPDLKPQRKRNRV
ncbi:hypothetical protein FB45DRAFT_791341 [Roridomyces roridus]|uniref:PCI domain-containing protein n=1 Tax=Roridomyces roridus TaxID=1738132 RepID=A0AAD7BVZ8_9AGAR|nr:hypothetical protein FB45DRAFT_791341 [Roridomyces roridus]